jgi:osmotically-inducible protein OsmY
MIPVFLGATLAFLAACSSSGLQTGESAADDRAIEAAVANAFDEDELLASAAIQIEAEQGVVTLSGTVRNAKAYLRALSIARDVQGVRPPVKAIDLTYPQ